MSKHVNNPINLWEEEQIADNKKLKKKKKPAVHMCNHTCTFHAINHSAFR